MPRFRDSQIVIITNFIECWYKEGCLYMFQKKNKVFFLLKWMFTLYCFLMSNLFQKMSLIWLFTSLSTLFKSHEDHDVVIIKDSVQLYAINS